MNYLLIGEDSLAKDRRISEIKEQILGSDDAALIDYDVLYSHKLKAETLKKALIALPAISKSRLIIIRSAEKLDKQNKQLVLDFFSDKQAHLSVVLDFDGSGEKNSFISKIPRSFNTERFGVSSKQDVFKVGDLIFKSKSVDALKMLSDMMKKGDQPVALLGGLLWFWGSKKRLLSAEQYKSGLLKIQEADMNIKRSKLKPEYAMEMLLVNLCLITS